MQVSSLASSIPTIFIRSPRLFCEAACGVVRELSLFCRLHRHHKKRGILLCAIPTLAHHDPRVGSTLLKSFCFEFPAPVDESTVQLLYREPLPAWKLKVFLGC